MPSFFQPKMPILGQSYYWLGVGAVDRYGPESSQHIPAAPLIHTYSPSVFTVSSRLALKKEAPSFTVGDETYEVERFLTVQRLDEEFMYDEAGDFRPTIKPHYAVAPVNGRGTLYNQLCKTRLACDAFEAAVDLPVHVHDHLLSPAHTISELSGLLRETYRRKQSLYLTSYVLDEINKKVLVTQHCLLSEACHDGLFDTLDSLPEKSVESLCANFSPMKTVLSAFMANMREQNVTRINSLFPQQMLEVESTIPVSTRSVSAISASTEANSTTEVPVSLMPPKAEHISEEISASMWFNIFSAVAAVALVCLMIAAILFIPSNLAVLAAGGTALLSLGMFACFHPLNMPGTKHQEENITSSDLNLG